MWREYAPEPRMKLNLGIRRRLAPLLDNDRRKIEVANSILFTLIGSPIIYYGDEIGMGDNIGLDDRNGVRTPMQWDSSPSAGFSEANIEGFYYPVIGSPSYGPESVNVADQKADPDSLYHTIKKMIAIRKQHTAFGWGSFQWVDPGTNAVAAYLREYEEDRLLILNNLTDQSQEIYIRLKTDRTVDILQAKTIPSIPKKLAPYQYFWLKL